MIQCTRRIEFDAAHRVKEHESKCKYLHGHRYAVEATFEANKLDALGRVIDFGCIKEVLGTWIDNNWDHNTILHASDQALAETINQGTNQQVFLLPENPTAENMAYYLLHTVCPSLFTDASIRCIKIKLYETPNCYVEVHIHD